MHPIVIVRIHRASALSFSGPQPIGRWWRVTSRPSQLIGVRSRFEERSLTGERDRGGSPEERRAAQAEETFKGRNRRRAAVLYPRVFGLLQ
ncbi:uncharacterized protein ACO6RY_00859 [Pungitius sinensis]